jgi:hypothetical protein
MSNQAAVKLAQEVRDNADRSGAERQLEQFNSGKQLCSTTRDNLRREYNKWLERSGELTQKLVEESS